MEDGKMMIQAPETASVQVIRHGFNFFDPVQFETMQRVCKMFAFSELVPDIYKASFKPIPADAKEAQIKAITAENEMAKTKAMANCMIAVSMASRMDADPLMVMQNMTVIHGKPTWASKFLIGTVNACGRYETLKFDMGVEGKVGKIEYLETKWNRGQKFTEVHTFDGSSMDNLTCVCWTREKGSTEILKSPKVDLRMAVSEGWYTKSGSKWKTMPELMLRYRAASMWTNTNAPEYSMGMRTTEEVRDVEDVEFEEVVDKRVAEAKDAEPPKVINMDDVPVVGEPSEKKPAEPAPKKEEPKSDEKKPAAPAW